MKKIFTILIIFFVLSFVHAQKKGKTSNANVIMDKVVQVFEAVNDFSVSVEAEIKMERVQIPKMNAKFYFKKPNKIHFSSQGFLLVPREGVVPNPSYLREHYDAAFIEEDIIEGKKFYKLQLAAKDIKTRLRQLYIWIDGANWTIVKTETIPYEGRTLTMLFTYQLQQDKYWLPSKVVVNFGSTIETENSSVDSTNQGGNQLGQLQRGMPRTGSISINYSDYKINYGIDDSIFEGKKK